MSLFCFPSFGWLISFLFLHGPKGTTIEKKKEKKKMASR